MVLALRQSYSKYLLGPKSPAELLHMLELGFRATAAMERGTLVDQQLFGGEDYRLLESVVPASGKRKGQIVTPTDWTLQAAREFRDRARADGKIAVLPHEYERAQIQADSVRRCLKEQGVDLERGEAGGIFPQLELSWTDEGGCKKTGKPDIVICDGKGNWFIIDVKCSGRVDWGFLRRQVYSMRWDVQAAAYEEGTRARGGERFGGEYQGHVLVVVEQLGDMCQCTWNPLSEEYLAIGRKRWADCTRIFQECVENDDWPCHVGRPLDPLSWMVQAELGDSDDENTDDLEFDDEGVEEMEP